MTKRCYPFQDKNCQPLKYYIHEKAIIASSPELFLCGVNGKDTNSLFNHHSQNTPATPKINIHHHRNQVLPPIYKQMYFDRSGQLCSGYGHSNQSQNTNSSCTSCHKQLPQQQTLCTFCEKSTCDACIQTCIRCSGHFCQLCALTSYDQHNVTATCLSCLN